MKNYVAYPRSGSHFLHQVLSCYINDVAQTKLYRPHHDRDLKGLHGCLYVWRNPVKVMFSLFSGDYCNEKQIMDLSLLTDSWIDLEINRIKKHFEFYWKRAGLVIRYKDLINNNAWTEILKFLGCEYDEQRIMSCSSEITLNVSIERFPGQWMNGFMRSDEYKQGRIDFEEKYEDKILNDFSEYLNKDKNYLTQAN